MPPIKKYEKPKKGTIKRLIKSLWQNFKFELIISIITLTLSILVNLCGSIFASLITDLLTKAIPEKIYDPNVSILAGSFNVALFGAIKFNANLTTLVPIITSSNVEHSQNADSPISKTLFGILIDFSL